MGGQAMTGVLMALFIQPFVCDVYFQFLFRDSLSRRPRLPQAARLRRKEIAVCCWTHKERDTRDRQAGVNVDELLAADHELRCECRFGGVRCERRQTGEDRRCDWCREQDPDPSAGLSGHQQFCDITDPTLAGRRYIA